MAPISYDDIVQKDILELLDLEGLPEKEKQAIYQKLYQTVENRAILRIDYLLKSDDDIAAWKSLLEKGDRAAADAFLKTKNIDVQRILIEESAMLKAQLVFLTQGQDAVAQPLAKAA